ncbi:hypothetical protein [Aeromonas sp. FDAARGOS 1404]|uniref:hypothetical protein n=1 Tax=Aeromonas TaxID=642 RepID=UPI001C210B75|nr:hypothetical protein [Aeromonas sp. FDAARGOS 1404]QWZ84837.1 hypothetical protein I6L34_19055 [Aeromonas sp. FDAARGOS 1404]
MHIQDLVNDVLPHIPFRNESVAQTFLDNYSVDDQLALISALHIGRSHNGLNKLMEDYQDTDRRLCDHIHEDEFARILYEKNTQLATYYQNFNTCGSSEVGYFDRF